MKGHRCTRTADGVLDVILEVTLDHPHQPLVPSNHLGWQPAVTALLHQQEVVRDERCLCVPHVDVGLALVPEENGGRVVSTQDDDLILLQTKVYYGAIGVASPQVGGLDGEDSAGAR